MSVRGSTPPAHHVDPMNDGSKQFSFDSSKLGFDVTSTGNFNNDSSRLRRASGVGTGAASFYYNAADIASATAKIYFQSGSLTSRFKVFTRPDNVTYTQQAASFTAAVPTAGGWSVSDMSIGNLPAGTNYIRFELSGGSSYWDIQVGDATVEFGQVATVSTLSDALNDGSNQFNFDSSKFGFDVTSVGKFNNDPSRLRRQSSVGTGAASFYYNLSNISGVTAKIYYQSGSLTSRFKVFTSADNVTYTQQTASFTSDVATAGGWYVSDMSLTNLPVGTNYLRFELSGGASYCDIQIGEITIQYA